MFKFTWRLKNARTLQSSGFLHLRFLRQKRVFFCDMAFSLWIEPAKVVRNVRMPQSSFATSALLQVLLISFAGLLIVNF